MPLEYLGNPPAASDRQPRPFSPAVRVIAPRRPARPAPIACALRMEAVIAIDMAGNCT